MHYGGVVKIFFGDKGYKLYLMFIGGLEAEVEAIVVWRSRMHTEELSRRIVNGGNTWDCLFSIMFFKSFDKGISS